MKIAVLGAGAMGTLFGAYLSLENDVWLIDNNVVRVALLQEKDACVFEKDGIRTFYPCAVVDSSGIGPVDLVIVFVKAMFSRQALLENRALIGPETKLMTLQNGAGHERVLLEFVEKDRIILGTTQHNAYFSSDGELYHGGAGHTMLGWLNGDVDDLQSIARTFNACGLDTTISNDVKKEIWRKLLLNASASALTAVLQMPLGYIWENESCRTLLHHLIDEAVRVANAELATPFSLVEETERIERVLMNARNGYTSICTDIARGVRTEVDTISGFVVSEAERLGIDVPYQKCVVGLIRALEERILFPKAESS